MRRGKLLRGTGAKYRTLELEQRVLRAAGERERLRVQGMGASPLQIDVDRRRPHLQRLGRGLASDEQLEQAPVDPGVALLDASQLGEHPGLLQLVALLLCQAPESTQRLRLRGVLL